MKYHYYKETFNLMEDHEKTKTQLINELAEMRRYIAELEKSEIERRQTEKDLIESEERYRTVIENSNDGVALVRGDHHIYTNRKFLEMFGYDTPEDFSENTIYGGVHPDDREMVMDHNRKRQKGDPTPSRYEFKGIKKDGTLIFVEVSATAIKYHGEPCTLAYFRDITGRKQAANALERAYLLLEAVIEQSPVPMVVVSSPDLVVRYRNRAVTEILGVLDEPSYVGLNLHEVQKRKTWQDLTSDGKPVDIPQMPIVRALHGEVTKNEEYSILRKDGTRRWELVNATPVYNSAGALIAGVLVFPDISDRKQAEKEKEKLQTQLNQAQKMEAIGILAGGIAHDFNNILTALMGYGTLLQTKIHEKDPLHVYIDQILLASHKASSLIQGLLAFSRQQPITLNPTHINNIIKNTEKLLSRVISENIVLKTVLAHDNITIMADETQIDQILFNLVTNARDAMPSGGTITIETGIAELDDEFRNFHGYGEPGIYARLSISDTGTGMNEVTKKRIFDPFFTTKEVGKGTGLGLSTVYGIVKQHNGFITVYSEPDKGTTFHMYFPYTQKIIEDRKSDSVLPKRGKETVLVAEDNEAVRELMRDVLVEHGYTIIEAIDGTNTIEKFKKADSIDLLILDSIMPGKNGREVYNEISRTRPDIKVLFTSGYTRDTVLDKGIENKQFAFISKPMSPDALLAKVRKVLDK
jgi:two-component system cell cycle sensor histidine kinase/response regulator CckA